MELEAAALAYAEKEWDVIVNRVTSPLARGFVAGMKGQVIDRLRRAYLAGAQHVEGSREGSS